MPVCNLTPLTTYIPDTTNPWDETKVRHLFNTIGYGSSKTQLQGALAADPINYINTILDDAFAKPTQAPPEWANWLLADFDPEDPYGQSYDLSVQWVYDWINYSMANPFREKLLLFWSNHFVTKFESYGAAPWLYEYHEILQRNALGNFRTMTREVGLCSAMLVFLNGVENNKFEPNENYGRELMELFTLGLDNGYTEMDIREIARAFTGYNDAPYTWQKIGFLDWTHDDEPKTIFGQTDNFDYNGVIDLLFTEKKELIAHFICKKIYKHFVSYDVNEDIVKELAQTFLTADFELLPVFKQLLTSEHFFDENAQNNKIKSHFDYFSTFLNLLNVQLDADSGPGFLWYCGSLGQSLFDPVDVAGWPGNKAWIDSGSLLVRWLYTDWMVGSICDSKPELVIGFMKDVTGNSNDVDFVVHTLVDYFLVRGLNTAADYDRLLVAFKSEIPENYFSEGLWNLDWDYVQWQFYNMMKEFKMIPDITLA
ncbi:MAG TPA: DUF1800 domain-containing protein [Saprospiraceae bacterium]|nr:DUF1800 domain-containing protein [Saprospiraceae bacterium]